jgi:DNA-3-methyladenine glycosylase
MPPDFEPLPRAFYDRDTVDVARDLIGRTLIHVTKEGPVGGIIVETEAYGPDDPANHAHRGPRPRNASMFGPPGFAYVYRIYGLYWCVNAVTRDTGIGEAVLIRALEPQCGIDIMRRNRGVEDAKRLCGGPGRLCQALGITGELNGADLTLGPLLIGGEQPVAVEIVESTRIGISKAAHLPWRFCAAGNRYVSRKP